jgi:dihydrofolate synthase / folylpolyglutamate synthase
MLAAALAGSFVVDGTVRLVVGMLRNRDPAALLAPLARTGATVAYCCMPPTPRALEATAVAEAALALGLEARVVADPVAAYDAALADAALEDLIVVTGSFYVVGAVRGDLLGLPPHRG